MSGVEGEADARAFAALGQFLTQDKRDLLRRNEDVMPQVLGCFSDGP
jgi:hypothetical protein